MNGVPDTSVLAHSSPEGAATDPLGLRLATDFTLPRNAFRRRMAIIAMSGAGKSYLSMVMIERMVESHLPVVVIDPLGIYWGLRSSADGTGAGLPILILGGSKGDIPLDPNSGSLIADLLVEVRRPVILDLSLFANTRQACGFVAAFLTGLRRHEIANYHVFVDEADLFAPQIPRSPEAQLSYEAMDNLARRDRVRGLGATFITQRPAAIAKDVLSQVEALFSLRLSGPQDIKALRTWFELHATPEQLAAYKSTVLTLPTGTAWVWSPAWLQVFRQVRVQGRTTFDSSATPEVGEEEMPPAHLAEIDLASLSERMKALAERESEEPRVLKAKIARLEETLRQERAEKRDPTTGKLGKQKKSPVALVQSAHEGAEPGRDGLQQRLHEAETAQETLGHEIQILREQVALLSQLHVTVKNEHEQVITLPTTLPIAEAIVEHVYFGDRGDASICLTPQAAADLAEQLVEIREQLARRSRELARQQTLNERLRSEVKRLSARTPTSGAAHAPTTQGEAARPIAASTTPLTANQELLLKQLIAQVNGLSLFQRQLFLLLLPHEHEVTITEIAASLKRMQANVHNARITQLHGMQLVTRTSRGYRSSLTSYCRNRLLNAPVEVVRSRLLHALRG